MRKCLVVIMLVFSHMSFAELDLGNLVLEGEVRRPMMRNLVSQESIKKMMIEKTKKRLGEIEDEILKGKLSD